MRGPSPRRRHNVVIPPSSINSRIGKEFPWRWPAGRVALIIEVEKARYTKLPFQHTPPA